MATSKKKRSTPTLPLLMGAIGFGLAAALLSVLYLKAKEKALRESLLGGEEQAVMVTVVVANEDLPRGSLVADGLFAPRDVPAEYVHADVVYPAEYELYRGRSLNADLAYGKPLLKSFMEDEFPVDFSDTVPLGKRAITVTVDEINSVAGFMRPGNFIDIFVNIAYSNSGFDANLYKVGLYSELPEAIKSNAFSGDISAVLSDLSDDEASELLSSLSPGDVIIPVLQGVKVLATGRDPYVESLDLLRQPQYRSDGNFSSVTLEVTPEQAALIAAAQDKGDILALLRNRNDESASPFNSISSSDLFRNAAEMAAREKSRAARAAVASGVDAFGNLVDANGRKIVDRDALEKAGFSVNEDGQIIDSNGNPVDADDIIVAADGTIMTKQQLAAAGLRVDENGQITDSSGNVLSSEDIVVTADGTVMSKKQLAAAGLSVNEKGEIVDSKGRIIPPDELVVTKDGKVINKQVLAAAGIKTPSGVDASGNLVDASGNTIASKEQLAKAGYTINEQGQIVDKDGNIVEPENLLVDKDGNVVSADEVVVTENGSIITKQQLAEAGLIVDANGQVVDKDGNPVDTEDLVIGQDGSVLSKKALAAQGLKVAAGVDESGNLVDENGNTLVSKEALQAAGYAVNEQGQIIDKDGNVVDPKNLIVSKTGEILTEEEVTQLARETRITGKSVEPDVYDFIIGGASEDGVPKKQKITIQN